MCNSRLGKLLKSTCWSSPNKRINNRTRGNLLQKGLEVSEMTKTQFTNNYIDCVNNYGKVMQITVLRLRRH